MGSRFHLGRHEHHLHHHRDPDSDGIIIGLHSTGGRPERMKTKTLFEGIGYRLGKAAVKARNIFDLIGGDEAEGLAAEIRLGRDLEAAMLERV